MIGRRGVLGGMAGGAAVLLSGCGLFGGHRYRFRMTVEVETPQGLRSGSSVYEVSAYKITALTSEEADRSAAVRGEAVVVDLPQGPLFVLLKLTPTSRLYGFAQVSMAALDPEFQNDWVESAGRIAGSWSTLKGEVARQDWPLMVRFGAIDDPRSVEQVDPEAVGVRRITVETTSDPVTNGIEKRLGWLPSQRGSFVRRLSVPDPTNPPIAAILNKSDFSTEIGK